MLNTETINNNKDFWSMDKTPSAIYPGLSEAQEKILQLTMKGKSISWIARTYFGVNYSTVLNRTQSVNYIAALSQANKAKDVATLEECRMILTDIARHGESDSLKIKAIHELVSMGRTVSLDELAEIVGGKEMNREEAQAVLARLGIEVGDNNG